MWHNCPHDILPHDEASPLKAAGSSPTAPVIKDNLKHHERSANEEETILRWLKENSKEFRKSGGRQGTLVRIDPIHKGVGTVYFLPNKLGDDKTESLILFDRDTKITPGPDLWVYLSTSENVKRSGLGEYLQLILLKGTKGGQAYMVNKPITELQKYKSVVVWCKQFEVLFTYAELF